jgi:hypothetical protein
MWARRILSYATGISHPGSSGVAVFIDGFVQRPISALRFIPRHCGVPCVRLIPRDSQALISDVVQFRLWYDPLGVLIQLD